MLQAHIGNASIACCPICGKSGTIYAKAKDIEYFTTNDEFTYHLCEVCDLLYIDPAPSDRLAEIYPHNYYSFAGQAKKNIIVWLKEWLDKRAFQTFLKGIPGANLKVLDIGGGTGWLAGLLRQVDPRISVTQIVDIDQAAQVEAERNGHCFFCGRIEDFGTTDRYDVILMLNLIEHVSDPLALLTMARNLLTPRGRIYVKTPNFRSLDARLFRHRNWGGYHCPRHFVLFSQESFSNAVRRAGLAIDEFKYTQGAPFWGTSILEMIRRCGIVKVSAMRPGIYHPVMPALLAIAALFDFARRPFSRLSQMIAVLSLK